MTENVSINYITKIQVRQNNIQHFWPVRNCRWYAS